MPPSVLRIGGPTRILAHGHPRQNERHVAPAARESHPMTASETTAAPPATVLVVDDEEAVAYTLAEILAAEGYTVAQATSVAEALAAAEREPFDAAVLDLNIGEEIGRAHV